MALWHKGNRYSVNATGYMRAISAMRPDIFVAICDGEAPKGASNKRLSRSVSKTLEFLDVCIEKKAQDPGLRDTKLFAAIEVGNFYFH